LLRAINVGCINEIYTRLKCFVQDTKTRRLVGDVSEIHGTQAKTADFQARAAKMRIVHRLLRYVNAPIRKMLSGQGAYFQE
jgi:hypothetical protein